MSEAVRILLVDDDDQVRSALSRFLVKSGYDVTQADGGYSALERLRGSGPYAAMLSDMRMPGMSGLELLPQAIAEDPDMAIIMLTAVGDPGSAIQCLRLGAADYLIKPVEVDELKHALHYALRKRELEIERRNMEQWLAAQVAEKTRELEEQARSVEALSLSVLTALVDAIDPHSSGRNHSVRVANLCAHVASAMGLAPQDVETIRLAARLHDLGKLALRDDTLKRASMSGAAAGSGEGPPAVAARILEPLQSHADMVYIIRQQLAGPAVAPAGARILRAVNAYDELTEEPGGSSPREAMQALHLAAGTEYDPAVLKAMESVLANRL